jgi:ABC-type sugar transport system substrate-binding protein
MEQARDFRNAGTGNGVLAALRAGRRAPVSVLVGCFKVDLLKFWIIIEGDRSATTLLVPEEY